MNNQVPIIAILLATYNGEKYLESQIESLLSQNVNHWELYIRDDGSSDSTLEILRNYANRDSRIHILKDDLGTLGTRDQFLHLLNVIDADYYMFCDQDDVWLPDKIDKSLKKIQSVENNHPSKPILIGSDCYMCGPNLEIINISCWDHLRISPREFLTYEGICVYPFVTGASMILNKAAKKVIPPIPKDLPKKRPMYDWWVLINVFKFGIVELLEESTRYYRQHANNVSGGIEKLDNSYLHKIKKIKSVYHANKVRANVLKHIGFKPQIKYWFYKAYYFNKMLHYKWRAK